MRILFCVSDSPFPPFNTGYRQQLRGMVSELSKSHTVRLVGYRMPEQEKETPVDVDARIVDYRRPGVLGNARDFIMSTVTGKPLRAERYCRGLRPVLQKELIAFQPDLVHVGPGKLAPLLPELKGLPSVLGVMDAWHLNIEARARVSRGLRRWVFKIDAQRARRFITTGYRGWDRVVPSNRDDMEVIRALDPSLPFTLIPIGFDASAYKPDPNAIVDPDRIIFHGTLDYAPNIHCARVLAEQVLPLVREKRPAAHLALVGRNPSHEVRALDAIPAVRVVGPVENIRDELITSRVWSGPFEWGTGIKTKLLEAMATDLPAVVTPTGARGLDPDSGTFLVGADPQEIAHHILSVMEDDVLARELGQAGGNYVRQNYDWPAVAGAFAKLYETVIKENAGRSGLSRRGDSADS